MRLATHVRQKRADFLGSGVPCLGGFSTSRGKGTAESRGIVNRLITATLYCICGLSALSRNIRYLRHQWDNPCKRPEGEWDSQRTKTRTQQQKVRQINYEDQQPE